MCDCIIRSLKEINNDRLIGLVRLVKLIVWIAIPDELHEHVLLGGLPCQPWTSEDRRSEERRHHRFNNYFNQKPS